MKSQLEDLLHKPMSRREFLRHVLLALIVITGLSGVAKLLKSPQASLDPGIYGSSVYGGDKPRSG